jgi:hypothetical protein
MYIEFRIKFSVPMFVAVFLILACNANLSESAVPGDVSILFDSGMQNRASKTIMLTLDLFL